MNVLHRTTKQLVLSAHEPDYPSAQWIHDPDLSAVQGIDPSCWVIEGDSVRVMTDAEKDANCLDQVKTAKCDSIDARTAELVSNGFEYPPSSGQYFSLSLEMQSNLEGINADRDAPEVTYPITWSTKDNLSKIVIPDSSTFRGFYLQAMGTKRAYLDSGNALKDQVRAATTVAAVEAVVDSR